MVKFRYRHELSSDKTGIIKRPVAEVNFKAVNNQWLLYYLYIDSGADITLIPYSAGLDLGFRFDERYVQEIGGIRGKIPYLPISNDVKIGNRVIHIPIAWALVEEVPLLLGREGVFDNFEITFQQVKNLIIFHAI